MSIDAGAGKTVAQRAVHAIDSTQSRHDGFRLAHAKGVFCSGTFTPSPAAKRLSRAAHLQDDAVPVTVRFSNGSGDPGQPDKEPLPRGMAITFHLPDGSRTDIVAITLPRFFARTPDDFITVISNSKPLVWRIPRPRLALYLLLHPRALLGIAATRPAPPVSYATCRYNGMHAFRWSAADGSLRFVRYSWIPMAGEHALPSGELKERGATYLQEEIAERLRREPVRFSLQVQVAADGDPTADATAVWPKNREKVDVGTLELTEMDDSREKHGDILGFDPARLTDGIELSDDPLPRLRSEAYKISVDRRSAATGAHQDV